MTPQKRTFLNPTTEGDQRHLFGQGRPMAKDSSGGGASWYLGTTSQRTAGSGLFCGIPLDVYEGHRRANRHVARD